MATSEIIEIEGDLARLVTRAVQFEVPLRDALQYMAQPQAVTLPTIARSQRFAHWDPRNSNNKALYILAEIAPGIKNIRKMDRRYRLAMPWTYFWFVATTSGDPQANNWQLGDYYIYHARDQYDGLDSPMMVARLPNVYGSGRICWGTTGAPVGLSLANRIDTLVEGWYISTFNTDLDGSVPLPYGERNYGRWVRESATDPNCWRNWPEWTDAAVPKTTVRQLLQAHDITPVVNEITLPAPYIPDVINDHMTFGQWEEWFQRVAAEQRGRALTALENLRNDNPATVPDPATIANTEDDGGVPIDTTLEAPYRRR